MAMPMNYFFNHKTRMRQMLGGRGPDHDENVKQALSDGFVEVTADEQDAFGEDTQKLIEAGWNKSPRTLKNYVHILVKS